MIDVGEIEIRALDSGEAAMMGVRMVSRRGVTEKVARELVPDARRVAAPYPHHPVVQAWLAEIEFDAENFAAARSEEHTPELQSLMRISYAVFCLKKKTRYIN